MYHTRQHQYQSPVSAVHKLQQFAANDMMMPVNYPKRSLVSASAFSDPDLNWSREVQKTTIRGIQQHVVAPSAILDKRPLHWPGYGLPPPLKEIRQSLPHHSLNHNVPPHLSAFHEMRGKPPQNPTSYLNNSGQKIECHDQHYGVNSDSAFSRKPVCPSAVNSLDVEIHRLQGMITRVEMLREKYKYQEGALHYPSALPCPHSSPIYRRALPASPTRSKAIPSWYSDQQRRPIDRYPNNIHPFQQEALQSYHPNPGMNKMVQRLAPAGPFLKSTEQRPAFLDLNQFDGMPKIVDVRSLADDVHEQHCNKKETQYSQTCNIKVSPNARSCLRSTTEARNETGSVESHDSGVECTSSPIEMQYKKNYVYGRSKRSELPTNEDVFVREQHLAMLHYQGPNALSTHSHRLPGQVTSPPPLAQNQKKRLSRSTNETEVVAKKSKAVEGNDFINRPASVSVSSEHNQALDLTLKKRNGHGEKQFTNGVRVKTEPDNEPAVPRTCSCSEHSPDYCSSGMLHHHRQSGSMEDLADPSARVANGTSTRNPSENKAMVQRPQQHLRFRNRFILNLRQQAEGFLHPQSEQETQSNNFSQRSGSIDQANDSKDENTVENGVSKSSSNDLGKIQAGNKPQNQGQSPPNLDYNKTPTAAACVIQNKRSMICIDALVNEALRMSRSPSSANERPSLNSPLVETNDDSSSRVKQLGSRSLDILVSNQVETDTRGACGVTESRPSEVVADMNSSNPVNLDRGNTTSFCETQKSPQNSTSSHTNTCTEAAQTKLPEATVSVRPIKPFVQNPTGKTSNGSTGSLTEAEKFKIKFTAICNAKLCEIVGSESGAMADSTPSVQIPTKDGFRRLQEIDGSLREIYRVKILPTKEFSAHCKTQPLHSVYYREMSFPCVLRSEVPFIPTHVLVQILFPGIEVATVCRALQQCNILNRYMTCSEQDALQDDLRERGITSCKLVPLDELHNNWKELRNNLSLK